MEKSMGYKKVVKHSVLGNNNFHYYMVGISTDKGRRNVSNRLLYIRLNEVTRPSFR